MDYLKNGKDGETGTLPLETLVGSDAFGDPEALKTQIFIMTPAIEDLDITAQTAEPNRTLPQSDNPARYGVS
ncbi:hypothetical protein TGAMA5MH_03542 [Trichoderma gamsii]|uniref:Uncharacterized protein n=1 Tax=Trichoderma gamsii TaxID=398673 RepID=A0A2K0TGS9_9HYPO|nr:hypothetical protein TGAMA5MH_03542 [Trichoderma gamsii]